MKAKRTEAGHYLSTYQQYGMTSPT